MARPDDEWNERRRMEERPWRDEDEAWSRENPYGREYDEREHGYGSLRDRWRGVSRRREPGYDEWEGRGRPMERGNGRGWQERGERYRGGSRGYGEGMSRWRGEGDRPDYGGMGRLRRGSDMDYGEGDESGRRGMGDMRGPHAGRGPRGWTRSSERIREDICERMAAHDLLDPTEIDIEVSDGEVTLNGTVEDRRSKRLAEEIAESVGGVRDVHNRLTLAARADTEERTRQTRPGLETETR